MRRVTSKSGMAPPVLWAGCALLIALSVAPEARGDGPPLGRCFPRQELVLYAEFDGVDAHAEAWRKTAAYKVLNETATGTMLEKLITQVLERTLTADPNATIKVGGAQVMSIVTHAFRKGFALGVNRKPGEAKPRCVGFVLRGAAKGEVNEVVRKLIETGGAPSTKSETVAKPGGRKLTVVTEEGSQGFAWWAEGDDLVFSLVTPQGADAMISALQGDEPNAAKHEGRAELAKAEEGFEPVGLAFFDTSALGQLPPQAVALGLEGVKRLDYRWGFQGDALMTVTRIVAPAPRAGVLAILDQPTFQSNDLPPLPPGLTGFTVCSFHPAKVFDQFAEIAKAADPNAQAQFDAMAGMVQGVTGKKLREDLLGHLGPRMVFYSVPEKITAPTNALIGLAQGLVHVSKTVAVIEVDDAVEFGKILDDVMNKVNPLFKAQADEKGGGPSVSFTPLKGKAKGYVLSAPASAMPMPAGFRPTILVGKKHVYIGSTPDAARRALALEGRKGGLADDDRLAQALGHAPKNLIMLNVSDTRDSMLADAIANLPGLVTLFGSGQNGGSPVPWARMMMMGRIGPGMQPNPPGTQGLQIKIDPDDVPSPEEIRPFLFPSTFAMTADDQGFQLISRESFPALNPTTAAPIAVALLLPAVQASRSAARRAQSTNNLKQIGLAMHNYHSTTNHFPPASLMDKDGKKALLSWRVAILPYIEQAELYNEFHLDEPWDSEHNKALVEKMPATFAVPGAKAEPGMTFYRGFGGKSTIFDPDVKDGVGIADVTDGTSNTIAVVEAKKAVPWTKPETDIPFDAEKMDAGTLKALLEQLGAHFPGGCNVLFCDGSVRFLKKTINPSVLRALITRNAGEVVSNDSY